MKPSDEQEKMVDTIADNCLSVRLRLLNRMIGAIYDDALRPHGIKASQVTILVAVAAHGRTTSRQLCRTLHMDASTFSRALARLKKNGWVQVSQSGEGKVLNVEVTRQGFEKIEQVYADWQRAQEKAAGVLGASAAEVLVAAGNKHLLRE